MERETLPDGSIRIATEDCSFSYTRLRPDALLVRIRGYDQGKLGFAPLDEMGAAVGRGGPVEIFVDARAATGVTTPVREEWTAWFQANRARLRKVHVLVLDRFMRSAVDVSQHLSRLGSLFQIYGDVDRFEQALGKVVLGG